MALPVSNIPDFVATRSFKKIQVELTKKFSFSYFCENFPLLQTINKISMIFCNIFVMKSKSFREKQKKKTYWSNSRFKVSLEDIKQNVFSESSVIDPYGWLWFLYM
jgi:predicted membrane protein